MRPRTVLETVLVWVLFSGGCGGTGGGEDSGLAGWDLLDDSWGVRDVGSAESGPQQGDEGVDVPTGDDGCEHCTGNDATFVSQEVALLVTVGSTFEVTVRMKNSGITTWTRDDGYKLGSQNIQDNQTWGTGRVYLPEEAAVVPGETWDFVHEMTAPSEPGIYDFQWRMLREDVEWFGALTENLAIEVQEPEGWPQYPTNPFVIPLDQPVPMAEGGIFAHDLTGDGLMDFVVTSVTHVGAYDHDGDKLWVVDVGIQECEGLYPGLHHPAAIAGDLVGDAGQEVAWLAGCDELRIHEGLTGALIKTIPTPGVEAVAVANLRGEGDRDALLQLSQTEVTAIRLDTAETIWETDEFVCIEHSMLRQADLDGDGLDEVAGLTLIDHDGAKMHPWDLMQDLDTNLWSVDSAVIADVVPGGPLEVALAEQGGNNEAIVVNRDQIVFHAKNPDNPCCAVAGECLEKDCDKVAVGDFDPNREGLEVFCRSACGQAPWMFGADGALIAAWVVNETKPEGWYLDGIEEVCRIDWDGDPKQEIVLKERHVDEAAAIVDPMTGEFQKIFDGEAVRVYAVDVSGDYREEVITVDLAGEIRVFWNAEDNDSTRERHWEQQHYRRQKQNWNYYSP